MIIYGKNSVNELFTASGGSVEELYVSEDSAGRGNAGFVKLAKDRGVKLTLLAKEELAVIAGSPDHQGVAAKVPEFAYASVGDIVSLASGKGERLLVVILDHVQDPQNLGAIIRTVNVLGAHGVVIPKDRSASVTPAAVKASAGAANHVYVSRVVNISALIRDLKKKGVWIVGGESGAGKNIDGRDFSGLDIALVIGSEGRGLSAKIREECDFLVSIPQVGEVSSLNASVAAGIMIYELVKGSAGT